MTDATYDATCDIKSIMQRAGRVTVSSTKTRPSLCVAATDHMGAPDSPVDSWIVDSGSGNDLTDNRNVDPLRPHWRPLLRPFPLSTAGGRIEATHRVPLYVSELNETVEPMILPDIPDVLSLGRRCVAEGYDFWWPRYSMSPQFTLPNGQIIIFSVRGFIPYLDKGSPSIPTYVEGPDNGDKETIPEGESVPALPSRRTQNATRSIGPPKVLRQVCYDKI